MSTRTRTAPAAAAAPAVKPMDYDTFLSKLPAKDRQNVERHIAECEAGEDPRRAKLWRRLACSLAALSTPEAKTDGRHAMRFYVPDGKYRMQVFAMEDRDGRVMVYARDVLDEATAAGVLARPKGGRSAVRGAAGGGVSRFGPGGGAGPDPEANLYHLPSGETLDVERLDGKALELPAFYKDMLGWNRKAVRIAVPYGATGPLVSTVESLCALAAPRRAAATTP